MTGDSIPTGILTFVLSKMTKVTGACDLWHVNCFDPGETCTKAGPGNGTPVALLKPHNGHGDGMVL